MSVAQQPYHHRHPSSVVRLPKSISPRHLTPTFRNANTLAMSDWPEAPEADAWLWRVLQKERNRLMVARLEDTLATFLANASTSHLKFPPRNAFHRRVCFAVARRYHLDHRLEACPAGVSLVLFKTPTSAIPNDRLDAFAKAPMPLEPTPQQQPPKLKQQKPPPAMFLKRPDSDTRKLPIAGAAQPSTAAAAVRSITEEDYQRARARIFKPAQEVPNKLTQDEPTQDEPAQDVPNIVKLPTVAKGPTPGSTGFERRRKRAPEKRQVRRQTSNEDLQDPDFDRRYDKWALRKPPTMAPAPAPAPAAPTPVPVFGQLLYPYPMPVHPTQVGMHMPVVFTREDAHAGPAYGLDSTVDFPPLP